MTKLSKNLKVETTDDTRYEKIEKIIAAVKKSITPDYKLIVDVDEKVSLINAILKTRKIRANCVKGGSIAKDTFLKNDHDIDLFVRFHYNYKDSDISSILESVLKDPVFLKDSKNLKKPKKESGIIISKIHGSRDYFQFVDKKLHYEIIPVLMIHSSNYKQAQNVTDLSPEHVFWVKKYTEKNKLLTDEIRVAKQFCKANGVYGAESYINGFSGHIVDILVIHFGSFLNLVKFFSSLYNNNLSSNKEISLKNPIIIDTEKNMKNPLKELNISKLSPLIIIDPIQKDRNAAAALNQEKLTRFILSCKRFLNSPSKDFFIIKKFDLIKFIDKNISDLRKRSEKSNGAEGSEESTVLSSDNFRPKNSRRFKLIVINIETLDGSKDVVGTKVLKVYEQLQKHLMLNDFVILKSDWNFDFDKRSALIFFILEDLELSESIEHAGPPIISNDAYKNFCDVHSSHETFIKNNKIFAVIPRKYTLPEIALKDLFMQDFIRAKVKKIIIKEVKKIK